MYCVYWTETHPRITAEQAQSWLELTGEPLDITELVDLPRFEYFGKDELSDALRFCEHLRKLRKEGHPYKMICMASEDPNSVGEPGVKAFDGFQADGVTPYDWKKRRI
jgi:hypothetical protein